jgi:alanyl-tRNA synthetase
VNANEIRKRFLQFFAADDHTVVPSSSLIPANDPTLFFVNAGMVQFKDVFTGREDRAYVRATSAQRCLRVSGKHNDLEEVGKSPRHHTLFEMLGNFSFGDYFKAHAIRQSWAFLTQELGIDPQRLWVTVFTDDDEAFELWSQVDTLPEGRIQRLGEKDNFWSMGDTGPCGPCSEIFFDHGPEYGPPGGPETESDRYVEIWNLVFMQFERAADGTMTDLPRPSIDTGAGLERICAVMQGVYSNYDTDVFQTLVSKVAELAGVQPGEDEDADVALRVIADHTRATGFLIADGVMPSNEERGYVLRRVMRRAIRFGVKVGLEESFLWKVVDTLIEVMGDAYPELRARQDFIREVVKGEEERFSQTLDKGLSLLEEAVGDLSEGGVLSGSVAFKLYDTFGFPIDLTRLIVAERGIAVDEDGYTTCMEAQRAAGRAAWKGSGADGIADVFHAIAKQGVRSEFTGHAATSGPSRVLALLRDGGQVERIAAGETGIAVVAATPFYGESGGQVGDTGTIQAKEMTADVTDTQSPIDGIIAHQVRVTAGELVQDTQVTLTVDVARRDRIAKNHTATHLLHAALRTVLGEHVLQKGSMVAPDRLRFDFSHHRAVTAEELARVEDLVYTQVLSNADVATDTCSMDDALARGAMALFGEKYGQEVRVVQVPDFSTELCGGTHVGRTGDIGIFRITSETSVAAGVRRIEAETGLGAFDTIRERETATRAAAKQLRTAPEALAPAIAKLVEDKKRLEKEVENLKRQLTRSQTSDLTSQARDVGGIRVLAAELDADAKTLREEADRLRDTLGSGVVVLGTRNGGTVKLVVTVSKDLAGTRVHAGDLVRAVAQMVGGGGGGRPDMAQAGGKNPDALPEALAAVYDLVGA